MNNAKIKITKRLQELYDIYNPEEYRWVVSYSGGKDSSLLLDCVLDFSEKMKFDFEVLHHNTGVEYPILEKHVRKVVKHLRKLDITVTITKPEKSFFEYMVERGYSFPKWNFRWCCVYLKWYPTIKYFDKKNDGVKFLNLIAIRGDEKHRNPSFLKFRYNRGKRLKNVIVSSPLIDLTFDDVWNTIKNEDIFGVEVLYPYKDVRFGCWTCTVSLTKTLVDFHPDLAEIKYDLVCTRCKDIHEFIQKLKEYKILKRKIVKNLKNIVEKNEYNPFRCGKKCNICSIEKWKLRFRELLKK